MYSFPPVRACIFDLIDNSIDAARDSIFSRLKPEARDELPESYNRYKIDLTLDGTRFKIEDNCGGIEPELAERYAFRMGRPKGEPEEDLLVHRGRFKCGQRTG